MSDRGRPASDARGRRADAAVHDLLLDRFRDPRTVCRLRETFARDSYVGLGPLVRDQRLEAIRSEADDLKHRAQRRCFTMPGYWTPRRLSTLGGSMIADLTREIAGLYSEGGIWSLMGAITGQPVHRCRHPEEFIVANFLVHEGDTHGWHLDDPAYALVIVLEAPSPDGGALLEFVPDWRGVRRRYDQDRSVEEHVRMARGHGLVRAVHHRPGEAYVLRADRCLHRVTELTSRVTPRSAISLAFQADTRTEYGETATSLYA